jgi:cyclophilin family peptidyl-prolyl cis-trans isomerase
MSSLRRIALPILALAAVVLVAGCGGGGSSSKSETTTAASSAASERPPLDPAKTYTATMKTSEGTFSFTLDVKNSPNTTASFASLVKKGFYDGLTFHRIVPDFVIQGGDPTGTGRGGPGYQFEDEFNEHRVERGALAMANAGPNTNGSQFFIVTAEACPWLDGKHTVFGHVTGGMDVVDEISDVATGAQDKPEEEVRIESLLIQE